MNKILYTYALLTMLQANPMCQTYQQKLIAVDKALTQNTPETAKTTWIISTLKTVQATFMDCLNVHGIPTTLLDTLNKLSPQDKNFKQAFQLVLINYSIYVAILESHPLIKLFCSPTTASCTLPGTLNLNQNYFTKSYFHSLIQRILRLVPHANDLQRGSFATIPSTIPCAQPCESLKTRLLFLSDASILEQLQTIETIMNTCIDFYLCAPNGCHKISELATKKSLTSPEINTTLTNFEIRLAVLESQPTINLFCPTQATCNLLGFITTLDPQQRIDNLTQRLLRIWPSARAQFPVTCTPEQPDIEQHDGEEKKSQESGGGDGDDTEKEKNTEKRDRDIPSILK